jgi:hypothetical protein
VLIFDIETDGFLDAMTRIHLLVLRDVDTNAVEVYRNNDVENTVEQGVRRLMDAATAGEGVYLVAGHNVIKFDVPAIQKFFPWFVVPQARVLDTIILGRLMYPDLKAQDGLLIKQGRLPKSLYKKHSLEAWGRRLGNFKGEYEGDPSIPDEKERKARKWERWNQAMEDYCVQDTDTTASLYRFLLSKSPAPVAVELEHQVAWILARQERYGFQFDKAALRAVLRPIFRASDVQTHAPSSATCSLRSSFRTARCSRRSATTGRTTTPPGAPCRRSSACSSTRRAGSRGADAEAPVRSGTPRSSPTTASRRSTTRSSRSSSTRRRRCWPTTTSSPSASVRWRRATRRGSRSSSRPAASTAQRHRRTAR